MSISTMLGIFVSLGICVVILALSVKAVWSIHRGSNQPARPSTSDIRF